MVSMYIAIENPFNVGVDTVNMRAVDINDDLGWEQSSDFNIAPARVVPKRGKNNRKNWDKWYAKPDNKIWHSCRLPFYLTHTHIIMLWIREGTLSYGKGVLGKGYTSSLSADAPLHPRLNTL